jgi:hypothetical protein
MFLYSAVCLDAARSRTRILALKSNASLVIGAIVVNRAFWSTSLDAARVSVVSILAQADGLSLRIYLTDGVWAARAWEAGADGRLQALAVWVSFKSLSAEALLLVSSDVAIGVRSARAGLTQCAHWLGAAPVRVSNGVDRAIAGRFTSRVAKGAETARVGVAWVLPLDAAADGVGQLDVATNAGATSESVMDGALGVRSAGRWVARVLRRSARHDGWFTLILRQAEAPWIAIHQATARVRTARIRLAKVTFRN